VFSKIILQKLFDNFKSFCKNGNNSPANVMQKGMGAPQHHLNTPIPQG